MAELETRVRELEAQLSAHSEPSDSELVELRAIVEAQEAPSPIVTLSLSSLCSLDSCTSLHSFTQGALDDQRRIIESQSKGHGVCVKCKARNLRSAMASGGLAVD